MTPRLHWALLFCLLEKVLAFAPQSSRHLTVQESTVRTLHPTPAAPLVLRASRGDDTEEPVKKQKKRNKKSGSRKKKSSKNKEQDKAQKEELIKAVGERMRKASSDEEEKDASLLDRFNPFKAGQNLRKTIDTALTSIAIPEERKSVYYVDDRFSALTEGDNALERLEQEDYIPEVLVVGATGEVGRLVVKRLLLDGRFRVRVLVRDLYTKTLNMLGAGVTYCQGELNNEDSLEFAVTDVDKIVFCSNPPRPDEEQFQEKFREFMKENLASRDQSPEKLAEEAKVASDEEWEQLESVLRVRAELAEQIDYVGLRNLIQAFQNVRHSDYGTSQAAKRSLFKFQGRPEDFNLFGLADDDESDSSSTKASAEGTETRGYMEYFEEDDEDDEYADEYGDDELYEIEKRRDISVKTQSQWIRNQFGHGVFVGRVPQATGSSTGGEAAIISSRLRSRQDPDNGIDLGTGFAGFICRVCSDGGTYEAFVRTGAYDDDDIEYVCKFSTATKPVGRNKSKNKFATIRLPFESFKPVQRTKSGRQQRDDSASIAPFDGSDVRSIGFRYRSADNKLKSSLEPGEWSSFYLALSYIKLYRSQPEPEFIYLSDAEIPPVVRNGMVRHEAKQLITSGSGDSQDAAVKLLDESTLQTATRTDLGRSPEETYYKYRGEELIKNSGLNYVIARVAGYNEISSAETSTIDLRPSNKDITPVSRAEIAQVCASALLDPSALNKSFYVTKKKGVVQPTDEAEDMRAKFRVLPADIVA